MAVRILAFGIAKEIFSASCINMEVSKSATVTQLKAVLEEKYPRLKQLASYRIAVNAAFANDETTITEQDEVAIIPPVSGG